MKDKAKKTVSKFPVLVVITTAVFISFSISLFVGQGGIFRLRQIRSDYDHLLLDNYYLALQNKKLSEEIERLKSDPAAIEKIAREEMHYVAPHDTVLIVPEDDAEGIVTPQSETAAPKL